MIIIKKDGRTVSRSRNLRGILRYTSSQRPQGWTYGDPVTAVHVLELPESGALLRVRWRDGAYAVARFASVSVARRWCQTRRTWPPHRFTPLHYWHAPTRGDA